MLDIALVTLGDPDRLTGGYLYHRRMAEAAPAHDARLRFVSFPDRLFPLAALAGGSMVRSLKRKGAAAVVIDSIAAAYLAPWLSRLAGVPLIGSLHQPPGGIDHGRARAESQAVLDRRTYRRCAVLIAASDALADELVSGGLPRERIRVVPPGRDVATEAAASPGDLRGGRRAAILCVANWIERKGILDLLEAIALLPDDAATLHLIGDENADASYAARVRARLARPDLAGRTVVHARRTREEVCAFYRAADVFALPSYVDPYGTVWGEAMAEGLPVVGWRAGNLPHLADDGREALMAEPGDIAGLTARLRELCEDEGLRDRLGEAARSRALQRPTWEQSAALFFGAIREGMGLNRI
jgi:glycosyltransferase involved in cell wall biosynthesis